MAKHKNDPANTDYDAGDDFNYEVWTANTQITLCNVPWDATYKDVVHFESTNKLNEYIDKDAENTSISNAMYARVDEPISIDMPFGSAQQYNYVRVFNPAQPVMPKDQPKYYYYFIRGIRHVGPNTTEIIVQLDLWQTWIRLVEFGRAYIDRGHIGIANKDAFRNYGRDFLTIAEGIDTGSEYVNVVSKNLNVMDPFKNGSEPTYNVMAVSTVDLNGDHGTEKAPKNPSARPSLEQSLPTGAAIYYWESASDFMAFLSDFSKKPWVTAGIISITLVPDMRRWADTGAAWGSVKDPVTRARRGYNVPATRRDLFKGWRDSSDVLNYIPQRYRHLKKLLTSPYCMIEMTYNAGSAVALKPESWNSADASIVEKIGILPPNQRIGAIPLNYNGRNPTKPNGAYFDWTKDGDYLDMAVFLSAFPTLPIVNNGQILALAQSARSIASQYSSNDWAQQRALQGNQVSYDNAGAGINAGIEQTLNSVRGDQAQTQISTELASQQALFGAIAGTAQGAGMGAFAGPAGAVAGGVGGLASGIAGAIGTGMNIDAQNRSLAARTNQAYGSQNINTGLGNALRDSNKGLADWAAKGDYANNRAQMDAKIQDMQMTPHGMSGQFGGETFNLVNDEMNLTLRFKMIDQAAISVIGEYWLRFGYPVRRSTRIPNDLRVMTKFSYWKVTEIYIRNARMPESYKQAIRGIMEKGVTVWTNADDMGLIDFADNQALPNIYIEGYVPPEWEPEDEITPPVTIKRKKKKMLVYSVNDGGMKYALAGTSPGTDANWIETTSETLKDQFLDACGVDSPVALETLKFYELKALYLAPVSTVVEPGE